MTKRLIKIFLVVVFCTACTPFVANQLVGHYQAPILQENKFITSDGSKLPVRQWGEHNPKAIIVALHGFNDYSNFIHEAASKMAQQGIMTLAFDQRGFGQTQTRGYWSGTQKMLADVNEFVSFIHNQYPELPIFLLGESMGGAVALLTSTQYPILPISGMILSAPAVWAWETMPWYQRWALSIASYTIPWKTFTGKGLKIQPSDNIEMLRELSKDPNLIRNTRVDALYGLTMLMGQALENVENIKVNTLILYGNKDEIIPKEPTSIMLDRLPKSSPVRLAIYQDGYHMLLRDLQADVVLADILAWIKKQPLPSKADKRSLDFLLAEK